MKWYMVIGFLHPTRTLVQFDHLGRTLAGHYQGRSITPERCCAWMHWMLVAETMTYGAKRGSIRKCTFYTARSTYIYLRIFWDVCRQDDYLRLFFLGYLMALKAARTYAGESYWSIIHQAHMYNKHLSQGFIP